MVDIVLPSNQKDFIHLPESRVDISLVPVSRSDYYSNGSTAILSRSRSTPITNISASEARAFAARREARLPEVEEFIEFLEILKHGAERVPRLFSPAEWFEWLNCCPKWGIASREMNCVALISSASMSLSLRGSMQDRGYPFVTFRIVRP